MTKIEERLEAAGPAIARLLKILDGTLRPDSETIESVCHEVDRSMRGLTAEVLLGAVIDAYQDQADAESHAADMSRLP